MILKLQTNTIELCKRDTWY